MLLDIARVRHHLKAFDLHTLFIEELGWEHHRQELVVPVDGQDFRLQALAHKRGLVAFRCDPDAAGRDPALPDAAQDRDAGGEVGQPAPDHLHRRGQDTAGLAVGEARAGQADRLPRAVLLPRPDGRGADPEAERHRLQPGG